MLLSGCGQEKYAADKSLRLTVVASDSFTVEGGNIRPIPENGLVELRLSLKDGYMIEEVSYPDWSWTDGVLTLRNVRYPTRLVITCREEACRITYDTGEECFTRHYSLAHHIRPNTENGADITRDGYTLIGWNTEADGSGEHIGLGSRVSVPDSGEMTLYAEWVKWSDPADFAYEAGGESVIVTGYTGADPVLCVPAYIEGKPVEQIDAVSGNFDTLILPTPLRVIGHGAFEAPQLRIS